MTSGMQEKKETGMRRTNVMIKPFFTAFLMVIATQGSELRSADILYDIANDWSDVNNPNGVWQINKAPNTPFTVNQPDWAGNGTNQKAWADAQSPGVAHVPAWMKVTDTSLFASGFVDVGTVVMHGAEFARTGTDLSSLVWTSPTDGVVTITGGVWKLADSRSMVWEIRKNDVTISSGQLNPEDSYTKTNPFAFSSGSGGTGAMTFSVQAGNKVELIAYRTSLFATYVAMNYQLTVTPVPEPSTYVLGTLAVGVIAAVARRKPKSRGVNP